MDIPITKRQKNIIIGSVLGDGCLEFNGYRGTRLQIKQAKKNKEYVFWLYCELKNLCRSAPKQRKDTMQWYFSTRALDCLTNMQKIFYQNGMKVVPDKIGSLLSSSLSLAIWYMDDGSLDYRKKDHYSFSLSVDAFKKNDVIRLKNILKNNFDLTVSIQKPRSRQKRYFKLYIGASDRDNFLYLVQPYLLKCFFYKKPPSIIMPPQRLHAELPT